VSEIIDDILDEVELTPSKTKKIVKWVIRISIAAIILAFSIGKLVNHYNTKLTNLETGVDGVKTELKSHKDDDSEKFNNLEDDIKETNRRIDDLYKK
jgi:uncharacterized protein YoxC